MASICGSVVGDVLMLACVTVEAPTFVDSVLIMGPSDVFKERPSAVDRTLVLSFNSVTVLLGSCLGIVLGCCWVLLKRLVLPSVLVLASCSLLLERLVLPPGVVFIIVLLARVVPPLVLLLMLLVVLVVVSKVVDKVVEKVVDKVVDKVDKVVDKVVDKDWRAASAASYFSVSTAITSV